MEKGYNIDDILSEVKKRREEAEAKIKSDSDEKEIVGSLANDEPTVEPTVEPAPEPIEEPVEEPVEEPEVEIPEEPEVEIPEEDVPLAEIPETGDTSAMWILAAAVSGIGLVWLSLTGKKRKEESAE